jgi:hypothetical protein
MVAVLVEMKESDEHEKSIYMMGGSAIIPHLSVEVNAPMKQFIKRKKERKLLWQNEQHFTDTNVVGGDPELVLEDLRELLPDMNEEVMLIQLKTYLYQRMDYYAKSK